MSTILLPFTFPNFIIKEVEIIFKTNFWAVPDFILVLPVTNSGPTSGVIAKSANSANGELGLQEIPAVNKPFFFAISNAPRT